MVKIVQEDEEQLIARSQRGDVSAFNQLVLRYQQTAYSATYRMLGDPDTAADITQDAFISAFRSIQSFHPGSSFRAWLLRIASNLVYDLWRRKQRRPSESLEALTDDDELHAAGDLAALVETAQDSNPEEFLINQELQHLIQLGLQELPPDQRVAVVLCDIQGLSYDEIAETTQTTVGTIRSRISRGRARLRDYLSQHRELLPRSYRLPDKKE